MCNTVTVITILGLIIAPVLGCEISEQTCGPFFCSLMISNVTHPIPGDTPVGQQIWVGTSDEKIEVESYNASPGVGTPDLTDLITIEEENGIVTVKAGVKLSEFQYSSATGSISIICPNSGNRAILLVGFYVDIDVPRLSFSPSRLDLLVSRDHNNLFPLNSLSVTLTEEHTSTSAAIWVTVSDEYAFTVSYIKHTGEIGLYCLLPIELCRVSALNITATNGANRALLPVTINVA